MNLLSLPLAPIRRRFLRWRCEYLGRDPQILGTVWAYGGGRILIGDRVRLGGPRGPVELHAEAGAVLVLGNDVHLEGGVSIEAVESVVLEDGTTVGAWTKILDNHFHSPAARRGERPRSAPVLIGRNAVIGERCVILPGARLGPNARLAPGVVVGHKVPAGIALEGNPPRRSAGRSSL